MAQRVPDRQIQCFLYREDAAAGKLQSLDQQLGHCMEPHDEIRFDRNEFTDAHFYGVPVSYLALEQVFELLI